MEVKKQEGNRVNRGSLPWRWRQQISVTYQIYLVTFQKRQ
jgi:hypothetical protein